MPRQNQLSLQGSPRSPALNSGSSVAAYAGQLAVNVQENGKLVVRTRPAPRGSWRPRFQSTAARRAAAFPLGDTGRTPQRLTAAAGRTRATPLTAHPHRDSSTVRHCSDTSDAAARGRARGRARQRSRSLLVAIRSRVLLPPGIVPSHFAAMNPFALPNGQAYGGSIVTSAGK